MHGGVKLVGAFLTYTYFWGTKPIRSEPIEGHEKALPYQCWNFAYPNAPGGLDNPMINPIGVAGAPCLAGLGCCRVLVTVSEKDEMRDRGIWYYEELIKSKWEGEAELVQVEEEEHPFHILHF